MNKYQRNTCTAGLFVEASYTVEASLLLSVILMVLIGVLNLSLFLTDSVRMSAFMAEETQVLARDHEEAPELRGLFRLHAKSIRVSESRQRVRVAARDQPDHSVWGERFEAEFTVRRRHPVSWIRKIRLLQADRD